MRGKHGYAEGASNVEDVGRNGPSLQSERWTPNKIWSVQGGEMLTRCSRMIRQSVRRMRCHGLFRKPVDVTEAFDTQRNLMTRARNLKVVS